MAVRRGTTLLLLGAVMCGGCIAPPPAPAPVVIPAAPAAAAPAAHPTLFDFLGVTPLCEAAVAHAQHKIAWLAQHFPFLQPKQPLLPLTAPANLLSPIPAVQVAAKIAADEAAAPQKIAALKYLATVGCGCYEGTDEAFLAALDDCSEPVRFAAVEALYYAANNPCKTCRSSSCCSPKIREKLHELGYEGGFEGCPAEPSARVRRLARLALDRCGSLITGPFPPPPVELPEEGPPVPPPGAPPLEGPPGLIPFDPDAPPPPPIAGQPDALTVVPQKALPTLAAETPPANTPDAVADFRQRVAGAKGASPVPRRSARHNTGARPQAAFAPATRSTSQSTVTASTTLTGAPSVFPSPAAAAPVAAATSAPASPSVIQQAVARGPGAMIVARVNGETVSSRDIAERVNRRLAQRRAADSDAPLDYWSALRSELQTAIDRRLLCQEARQAQSVPPGADDAAIAQACLDRQVRVDETVAPAELEAHYRSHASDYVLPAEVRWERVTAPLAELGSRERALGAVRYVRERALGEPVEPPTGIDFQKVRSERFGWTRRAQFGPSATADALFHLPIGEISEVLEDGGNVYLVRILERRPERPQPLTEAADDIRREILQARRREAEQEYLRGLRSRADVWTVFDGPDAPVRTVSAEPEPVERVAPAGGSPSATDETPADAPPPLQTEPRPLSAIRPLDTTGDFIWRSIPPAGSDMVHADAPPAP